MSDDNMKVAIDLDVRSTGEELVAQLTRQLAKLESRIKSINSAANSVSKSVRTPGGSSPSPSGIKTASDGAKAQRQTLFFDREQAKLFRSRITSQARVAADAARAERQSYSDFKARNAAKARYDASEVRGLRSRMQAESRIAAMRVRAENESVRALKAKLASQDRAARQKVNESTATARNEARQNAESIRSVRDRIAVHGRMMRQRLAEEKAVQREQARSIADAARLESRRMREAAAAIRENGRLEVAQVRHVERERSRHETARNRYVSNLRSGGNDIREGSGRVLRGSAQITAATTAPAILAARKGIDSRLEVDTAETNLKIFSDQTNEQIKAARKGFLDNLSIKNGLGIAGGLDAYSEVLKTGMKSPAENVKTIMEAVSALELDLKNTTRLAGLIDRNYGANSDPAKIKSALNAVAVAAREDPTQSNEIVEGVKRAFGALSTGNMTPEQLTALVSGGQSVGIQPGKAGTYVATLGKQLSMGNSKFLGKKNRDELNFAAKELGFGDARRLASEYSSKSYDTVMAVQERLAKMESGKRTQVAEALMGRQWSDEALQFSQSTTGVKKTYAEISDAKNANFLEEAARQRAESLQGQWNTTKTIFGRFWDSFGQGFEDILTSINRYFLELNSSFDYDKVKQYVVAFFDGVKEALGVKTWQELLHNLFGGDIGNIGPQIRAFAKGLTEGVMSIGRAIRGFASIFGGSDMSAETIGRLSGQFIALSLALVALSPVISVMGGFAAIVGGLAVSAKALSGLAGLAGRGAATGAAGAGAGAGILFKGLGLALSRMFALSVVAEIGENRGAISTWMLSAGKSLLTSAVEGLKAAFSAESIQAAMRAIVSEVIPAPIQRMFTPTEEQKGAGKTLLDKLPKAAPATPAAPVAPAERGYLGKAWDWLSSSLVGSAAASEFVQPPKGMNAAATPSLDPRPATRETAQAVLSGTVGIEAITRPAADPRRKIAQLTEALHENTEVHRVGLEKRAGFASLVHHAATAPADSVKSSLTDSASGVRNSVLSGSLGTGSMTVGIGGAPLSNSIPGSRLHGAGGLGYRGIIGGGGGNRAGGGAVDYDPNVNTNDGRRSRGATSAEGKANVASWSEFLQKPVDAGGLGMPKGKALATIAMMQGESGGNLDPKAVGDSGNAFGTAQWSKQRGNQRFPLLQKFAASQGKDWRDRGVQQQYLRMEMLGLPGAISHRKAYDAMMAAPTDEATLFEGIKRFENPQKHALAHQIRLPFLNRLRGQGDVSGGPAVPSSANDNAASSQVLQTARNLSVANEQCVSLAKAAVGAGGSVMSWQRGVSAEAGTLKPGTPVATFLDRMGRQSSRYAGGGTGTMGANRDHAGIFQEYIKDAAGKNIGMRIAEQYRGSGGVKSKDYMFGQGSGARNGSNYNVVNGADGQPLGGARNPMSAQAAAKASVMEAAKAHVPTAPTATDWSSFGVPSMGDTPAAANPGRQINEAAKVQVGRSQRKFDPSSGGWFDGVKGLLGYGRKASETAEAIKASPIKPREPTAPLGDAVPSPAVKPSLGDAVPPRVANTQQIGGGGGGGKGSTSTVNAPISINGTGMDPNAIANAVQRRLSEDMNRRTHDISPSII